MASNGNDFHVRQTDYTDREILAMLADHVGEDGFVDSGAIAAVLFPTAIANGNSEARRSAMSATGIRLSWMRRIGIVERFVGPDGRAPHKARWGITAEGQGLLRGRLGAGATRALDALDGAQNVLAVHALTEKQQGEMVSTLMRRAWNYGTARR